MHGAFDEASLRLAKALRRSPEAVEEALQDVGVDAPYLGRAALEGDPQGAISAVGERLGVPRRDLVVALFGMQGVPPSAVPRSALEPRAAPPLAPSAAESAARDAAALRAYMTRALPRRLDQVSVVMLVGAVALAAFASLALWRRELFLDLLVYAAAGLVVLAAVACAYASWRLHRAARGLRRLAGAGSERR